MGKIHTPGFDFSNAKRALLSALLREKGLRNDSDPALSISRRAAGAPIPLSFAQERLWFLAQLKPDDSSYNLTSAVRLGGDLKVDALERSISEIIRRHEVLRTTFRAVAGKPEQVIAAAEPFVLPLSDLQHLTEAAQETEVRQEASAEARRPFDLQTGPQLRARLFRLASRRHVLLVSMHHIITDGWSQSVFVRELATLYTAFSNGQSPSLPVPPFQYADYAVWQRQWLEGEVLEEQLAYWNLQLANLPELSLPTDHTRTAVPHFGCSTKSFHLSKDLCADLKALGRKSGVTLFTVMLAAFKVLLARYCGQEDIAVGTPVANRSRPEWEGMIGFFVNTVVLRDRLSGNPTSRELLQRVQETALAAFSHQELPFEKLVGELRPERNLSRNPLFQVLFVFQNTPQETLRFSGLELGYMEMPTQTTPFDLVIGLMEEAGGITGSLEFRTELFEPGTIARMAEHYRQLLKSIVTGPDQRIGDLPMLTPSERRTIVVEWNRTQSEYPHGRCIHELFSERAAWTPEAIAVISEVERLTYRQLDQRANQLACCLRRAGVGNEARVGICLERSAELVVAFLAVLKAGAAYVPLDPSYPKERLALLLDDARASLLLTHMQMRDRLPEYRGAVVLLDIERDAPPQDGMPVADANVSPSNLAYVIYTSGSTGRPKGVLVQHNNLVASTWARLQEYRAETSSGDRSQRRFLLLSSCAFDSSAAGIFGTLCQGGCLVLPPDGTERDPGQIADWINRHAITDMLCVPSLYDVLLGHAPPPELASLCTVIVAGEACPVELVRRHGQFLPATELYNEYGPTEATVWSTVHECSGSGSMSLVPIGRPIPNWQIYVLDRCLNPVPVGVPGELHIGGPGVARGYLHRPDLTAERFIPDPFSYASGARVYKTGDLARWRQDGSLEFLGRVDQQVKIRGFRIEPGEIEAALRDHADVRAAVVVVREDAPGGKRLVAYVVPHPGAQPSATSLRGFLRERLPAHLVPAAFQFLDALPLTPGGKLDRRALPPPEGLHDSEVPVPPRNPVDTLLAAIWCELLVIDRVSVHDNFFEVGGHSLLATQVMSRVRQIFQVDLPLRSLFERPTVAGLADSIQRARLAGPTAAPALRPVPRMGPLPLSFAQLRLWLFEQLQPGGSVYTQAEAVRIFGPLETRALEQSLSEIVHRHESLRTRFVVVAGQPHQRIDSFESVALPVTDLRHLTEAAREAEVKRRAGAEADRGFDLERGPLLRAQLLRLAEEEHVLLLARHHIVADGWSMSVYQRELAALYTGYFTGRPPALPPLPIQYADFAVWQREWLQGDVLEHELGYWETRLRGVPVLSLPTDKPRLSVQRFQGASLTFELSSELAQALRGLGRREGTTLFMTLLAAFQVLLSRYSGQDDIAVGTPIANRNRSELEGLIGFLVNTLVVRTDVSGNPTFRQLLTRVREVALGAYDHQEVPFEKVVERLQPPRDPSRHPLFQVMFVLQNAPRTSLELPGLRFEVIPSPGGMVLFDLILSVDEWDDELVATLDYDRELFEHATIRRIAADFRRLLEAVVANPELRIDDLPLPNCPNGKRSAPARRPTVPCRAKRLGAQSAPRTFVEKRLAEIWRSLLGVEHVGIHDNFFDLGGHSLLAAQMLFRTQSLFAQKLPLGAFVQNPTIDEMAKALTWGSASGSSILVSFRPQGTREPFFCVHPLGGGVLCYFELTRHLDSNQPFYAIRAVELDGEHALQNRIETMADCYVDAILGIQPNGPYLLGGWSLGGVIAFEMAKRFHDRGMRVALLALLDTQSPHSSYTNEQDDAVLLAGIASDLGIPVSQKRLRRLEPGDRLDYVVRQATKHSGERDVIRRTVTRYFTACKAHELALALYRPSAYPGTAALFQGRARRSACRRDHKKGWESLVSGGVEVHAVPGGHRSMMAEPRVRILAQELQECIDAALASG